MVPNLTLNTTSGNGAINLTLPEKKEHLTVKNFIIRLLYEDA